MPEIKTIEQFTAALANGPWAWPGGYPLYFITHDGCALSFEAAFSEKSLIEEAVVDELDNGWRVIGIDINYEDDALFCAHTNKRIESAYGVSL